MLLTEEIILSSEGELNKNNQHMKCIIRKEVTMIKIRIYDSKNRILFYDKILRINLPELLIIQKSTEWFIDPTPCFIHKSAVMKRLFLEMEDYFMTKNTAVNYEELPEIIKKALENYYDIHSIEKVH